MPDEKKYNFTNVHDLLNIMEEENLHVNKKFLIGLIKMYTTSQLEIIVNVAKKEIIRRNLGAINNEVE